MAASCDVFLSVLISSVVLVSAGTRQANICRLVSQTALVFCRVQNTLAASVYIQIFADVSPGSTE